MNKEIVKEIKKKEKKYKLSSLGKQARFRTFEDSFVWLNEAMIVNACFNAKNSKEGLTYWYGIGNKIIDYQNSLR